MRITQTPSAPLADHLEWFVALVAVLVFFTWFDQGEVACLQGGLLPCLIHQTADPFYHISNVFTRYTSLIRRYQCNFEKTSSARH